MDVYLELHGTTFVWDDTKARLNQRRHGGIAFEQAATVFFDPFLRMVDATRGDEPRDAVIGYDALSRLLFVVHVERSVGTMRIISARRATSVEREIYDS